MSVLLKRFGEYLKRQLVDYWIVLLICPALFIYILSNDINLISLNGLILRKICLAQFNETICATLKNFTNESNLLQQKASREMMQLNITFILPAIWAIVHFAGDADRKLNYKNALFVSVIGSLLQTLICIIATLVNSSDLSIGLLYLSQALNGLFGGGSLAFISACFSHISINEEKVDSMKNGLIYEEEDLEKRRENNDVKNTRSIRFSICESCLLLGQFLGSLLSGFLIGNKKEMTNFQRTYLVSFALYSIVLVYLIFMFEFLRVKSNLDQIRFIERFRNFFEFKFNFNNEFMFIKDTVGILSKKRERNARFHILSLLVIYFLGASVSLGISPIQYLYLVKAPISLTQVDYGLFKALNVLARTLSLLVVLPLLKYLSLPDYFLYLIGIVSELLNLLAYSAASLFTQLIWTAPVVYMFSNYFVVCIRLYSSKLVDQNETGKMFGIIALVEFLVLLTSSSLISVIYQKTVATFPSLVFIVCIGVCLFICIPYMIFLIYDLRKHEKTARNIESSGRSNSAAEGIDEVSRSFQPNAE